MVPSNDLRAVDVRSRKMALTQCSTGDPRGHVACPWLFTRSDVLSPVGWGIRQLRVRRTLVQQDEAPAG